MHWEHHSLSAKADHFDFLKHFGVVQVLFQLNNIGCIG